MSAPGSPTAAVFSTSVRCSPRHGATSPPSTSPPAGRACGILPVAPVLDADAAASYKRRLAELAEELDGADAAGDAARASRAEAERQWLLGELRQATGLGGRIRRAPAESERARVNVTRTLRSALDRISDRGAPSGRPPPGIHPHRPGVPV
jgi:hypothetical protein